MGVLTVSTFLRFKQFSLYSVSDYEYNELCLCSGGILMLIVVIFSLKELKGLFFFVLAPLLRRRFHIIKEKKN